MPALVDAHCHLGDAAFDGDRPAVLARAAAAGVGHVVVIGESLRASARATALAREHAGLSATAGVHPHEAASWDATALPRLRELLQAPELVAVGETGLDYHYDHAPRPAQRAAFEGQLALAADLQKAVVIHARDADDDMAALLRDWGSRVPALVLHSFAGSRALFTAGMEVGAYFSFSGMITFKNWRPAVLASECPGDRLLVETDAPYLAPVPHRGHRNEPAFVPDIVTALARQRGTSPDALARQTFENASRVFGRRLFTPLASRENTA
ncbi:MAG TPA: TatD family hydrolase [Gemmatimonadales bacterium]|nr:TatD family hydrolase [Gemmatimonadales bacterium]